MGSRGIALLAALLASTAGAARADEPPADDARPRFDLKWHAPAACPDGSGVRAAIERYMGGAAIRPAEPVVVEVELGPSAGDDWQGQVSLRSDAGTGQRVFRGPTCDQVAEAAALIVAIMLDPLKTTAHMNSAEAAAAKAREAKPPPAEEPPSAVTVAVGLQSGGDVGSLPAPTAGVGIVVGLGVGRVFLQAEATEWFKESASGGPKPGSGGDFGLATGGLRACVDAVVGSGGRFRFGPCAHVEAGIMSGDGKGVNQPVHSDALWAAGFGGLSVRLASAPLAAWLQAEVGSPWARPVYGFTGYDGTVFSASSVLFRATLGVGWTFP